MELKIKKKVKIKKGKTFCISPSQAMLGVEDGVVKVVEITDYDSVKDKFADPEALVEMDSSLEEAHWVVYEYTEGNQKGERYCLDAELFVALTSEW